MAIRSTFSNWYSCIARAGAAYYLKIFPGAILWRTRKGTVIQSPVGDESWWAVVETFALDCYNLKSGSLIRPKGLFVDVGGNIGAFALAALEAVPGARGISFEPGTLAFSTMVANLTRNGASDRVRAVNAAVVGNSEVASLQFYEKETATGGSTTVAECTADEPGVWVTVPATPLGQILGEADGPVDLVKMDIEGGEYEIIAFTPIEAWAGVKRLVAEYHPVPGHGYAELVSRMQEAGFRLERRDAYRHEGFGALWFVREK